MTEANRMSAQGSAITPIHATAVACRLDGAWRGVLLTGRSGAGKSDLALRLIGEGWRLVSDDYCDVWRSEEVVFATAPASISGRIELRGLGIASTPPRWITRIVLVVACGWSEVERMPELETAPIAGLDLPRLALDIRPASATRTLAFALRQV